MRTIQGEPHNQEKSLQECRLLENSKNCPLDPSLLIPSRTVILDKLFLVACDRKPTPANLSKKGFLGSHLETGLALSVAGSRGSKNVTRTHYCPVFLFPLFSPLAQVSGRLSPPDGKMAR